MKRLILSTTIALVGTTQFTAHADDLVDSPNRFSLGARFGMNFKASFRNNTAIIPPAVPANTGPATGGVNHQYDNGHVSVDASGNAGGTTWNWGYQNASQVVGGAMQFNATQAVAPAIAANRTVTGDPQPGVELNYQRLIGTLPILSGHWGLEAAFGYTDLDLRDNRVGLGSTTVTTDSFALNGVVPPGPGYNGTFAGPGPLLSDTPLRTTAVTVDTLASRQKLSGRMYSIRLGPFAEWNLTPQLTFAASLGLTLAPAAVDYDFSQSTMIGGVTNVTGGHASKTELLYGPYASGQLHYDFNQRWGMYIGAQIQNLTDLSESIGARTARLDQRLTVYGLAGISWKF